MQDFPIDRIFKHHSGQEFNDLCLEIFHYQFEKNELYRRFVLTLKVDPANVIDPTDIPFLPIVFFKSHTIMTGSSSEPEAIFTSSGTTGTSTSRHYVRDLEVYDRSLFSGFQHYYGNPEDYVIAALLPSYVERKGSSLVHMAYQLIQATRHPKSGFYSADQIQRQDVLYVDGKKVLLLGVTFALLDLAGAISIKNPELIVMETGGMKGRRKELVREEVHARIRDAFHVPVVHSEYGMTELLSQAYSQGEGIFRTPPWMKVLARDVNDPFSYVGAGKTGGLNIIDLANVHSCAFIETQDLGRVQEDGSFEVLGRFDHSDIRGCNLMIE